MARHNDVLEASRKLVSLLERAGRDGVLAQGDLLLRRRRRHTWMEERAKPINEEPVREAAAIGAGTLAVPCRSAP